jgi:hypothetical protein
MTTELLSLAQKRNAVERGLRPYFNDSVLERVLRYWEVEYGNKPSFVLNRFLSEICNTDDLRLYRKEILKQVLSEISEVERQIRLNIRTDEAVPQSGINPPENKKTAGLGEVSVSENLMDAFQYFVVSIYNDVPVDDQMEFDTEIRQRILNMGLSINMKAKLYDTELMNFLPVRSYSRVITALYETYCEFYGPVKADRVYARRKEELKQKFVDVSLHDLL